MMEIIVITILKVAVTIVFIGVLCLLWKGW